MASRDLTRRLRIWLLACVGILALAGPLSAQAASQAPPVQRFLEALDPEAQTFALWQAGEQAYREGDLATAQARLEALIQLDPRSRWALRATELLAEIAEEQGDYARADSLWAVAAYRSPEQQATRLLIRRINLALNQQDWEKSIRLLQEYVEKEQRSDPRQRAQLLLARLLAKTGQVDRALQVLPPALERTRTGGILFYLQGNDDQAVQILDAFEDDTARLFRGLALFRLGRAEEAWKAWQGLRLKGPLADAFRLYRGLMALRLGQWQEAQAELAAVRDTPYVAFAQYALATLDLRWGDLDSARTRLQPLVHDETLAPYVALLLGQAWLASQNWQKAVEALQAGELQAPSPLRPLLQIRHAEALIRKGAPESARHLLQDLEAQPDLPESLRAQALLLHAQADLTLRDWEDARKLFDAYPDLPEPWASYWTFTQGLWAYLQGRDADAATIFQTLVQHPEIGPYARLYWADTELNLKNYGKANTLYSQILRQMPDPTLIPEALWGLALTDFRLRHFSMAAQNFKTFVQKFPNHPLAPTAMYLLATSYDQAGEWQRAMEILDQIRQQGPMTLRDRATLDLANLLYNHGDYERATILYQTLIEEFPESPLVDEALEGIFWSAKQLGQSDRLDRILADLRRRFPTLEPLLLLKEGEFWLNIGRDTLAYEKLQAWLDRYPDRPERFQAHLLAGQAAEKLGDLVTAATHYRLAGNLEMARYRYGAILFQLGRYLEARNALEAFLMAFPNSPYAPEVRYLLGLCEKRLKNETAAAQHFDAVIQAAPESRWADLARIAYAEILWHQGLQDSAEAFLHDVAQRRTDEVGAQALLTLGRLYQEAQQWEKAVLAFLEVSNVYENLPDLAIDALWQAGECYTQMNRLKEAIVVYKRIAKRYPDAPEAKKALQRAKKLEEQLIRTTGGGP